MSATPPRVPIRDAATLILLDTSAGEPKVLMGRRSMQLVFLPGVHVFPGGRMEARDLAAARAAARHAPHLDRLHAATAARFRPGRAAGLAYAATRETFEETGLRVANAGSLVPIARAITPAGFARRYDTRFYVAPAEEAVAEFPFEERPDRELDSLGWHSLDALERLDLAGITRQVMADIAPRLRDGSWRDASRPMPFYRTLRGRFTCDWI